MIWRPHGLRGDGSCSAGHHIVRMCTLCTCAELIAVGVRERERESIFSEIEQLMGTRRKPIFSLSDWYSRNVFCVAAATYHSALKFEKSAVF